MLNFGTRCTALALSALMILSCKGPVSPTTPPSPQSFKLTAYQTLITVQTTLTSFSASGNPYVAKYKAQLNEGIASYNALEGAFVLYATTSQGDTSQLTLQEAQLVAIVTQLVLDFVQPMDAAKTNELRHKRAQERFDLTTLLTYLQIAATIAQGVPQAAPWAALASLVLSAVQAALAANQAATTVDLSQLHSLPLIQ